jgi:hypothetical protein
LVAIVAVALGIVVVAAVAGAIIFLREDDKHTLTGEFVLVDVSTDPSIAGSGSRCAGTGGYSDVRTGLEVVVKNEDGKTIANGNLGVPDTLELEGRDYVFGCTFPIVVHDIPNAKFYEVSVGRRGTQSYSQEELEAAGWRIELSLGDSSVDDFGD